MDILDNFDNLIKSNDYLTELFEWDEETYNLINSLIGYYTEIYNTTTEPVNEEDESIDKLSLWHFHNEEATTISEAFMDKFPEIDIELNIISDMEIDYQAEVITAFENNDMPDIIALESSSVDRFLNINGLLEDLSQFNDSDEVISSIVPYVVEVGTDENGIVKALSNQASAGAIGYKRDIALKYLGTDDPDIITNMLKPENIIDTADKLKSASGGKAKLWASLEEYYKVYSGSRNQPWVIDGKFNIDSKMYEFLDIAKELRQGGHDGGMTQWHQDWSDSIQNDEHMCYAIPTWGVQWIIDAQESDEVRIMENNSGKGGRWALATPTPYFEGGTWYGISKNCDNKELAWEFIKLITTDKEFSRDNSQYNFVSNNDVIEEKKADNDFVDPIVDQNIYQVYGEILNDINGNLTTEYDSMINFAFYDAMNDYINGTVTKEECINNFINDVESDLGNEISFD
ncbi:MAG: extracellular solute-binding protein [Eubacteriales bacterium]